MKITHISIKNFRNFSTANYNFENKNFLYGLNGTGKSSIIEAIYYFTYLKSFRNTPDNKVKNADYDYFLLNMVGEKENEELQMGIEYKDNKKRISINHEKINKNSNAFGVFLSIVFSVYDKLLADSSPVYRRKYIDKIISLIDREYFNILIKYFNVLKNKNALLKNGNIDDNLIRTYSGQLSKYSDYIYYKRLEFMDYFIEMMNEVFVELFEEDALISIDYYSSKDKGDFTEEPLEKVFEKNMNKEKEKMRTLFGVHLDDYIIKLNNRLITKIGSEGEKRLIGIALKYAELKLIYEYFGEYPVILIDDVFAEIDKKKMEKIMYLFNNYPQVIMTSPSIQDNILNYKEIKIS